MLARRERLVTQIFNLLYRRMAFGEALETPLGAELCHGWRIKMGLILFARGWRYSK
jgi:hypothetical protein